MRVTAKTLGFLGLPTFCVGRKEGEGVINNGVPTDVTMVVLDRYTDDGDF